MDQAGWASVADVLRVTGITDTALARAVKEKNDKGRLQLDGDRLRACQGHSPANTPVTREALEASWTVVHPTGRLLWHGTRLSALPGIARGGLQAGDRTHVHLAETVDSRVGKRANVEVLLAPGVALVARTSARRGGHRPLSPGRSHDGGRSGGSANLAFCDRRTRLLVIAYSCHSQHRRALRG
jgi:putative RNA 2'-phosphotransferase